jgi:hypothetical protein
MATNCYSNVTKTLEDVGLLRLAFLSYLTDFVATCSSAKRSTDIM